VSKGTSHKSQLNRLSRIEGQIRGLAKMVEDERYCIDILTQIKAIKSALISVEMGIVEEHMKECVAEAVKASDKKKRDKVLKEILSLLKASSK
jgi:DNA-binding FrmR family transcriptional regulator